MARARDHINVVRIIEAQISLFCGTVRELSGPGFLESLAPQWLTKKIWAVVLPSGLNNPRRPPRFVLVIYPNPKVSQPRTIVSLSKVEIVEPNFSLADPMLVMFDKSTKTRYKFLSEHEGEKHQMQKLYGACRGIPQNEVRRPIVGGSNPLQPDLPAIAPPNVTIPEDVELAMAINASIQSASQEGIPLSPVSQQPSGTSDLNGWGNTSEGTSNGWGPPDMAEAPSKKDKYSGWSDEVGLTSHNGWGTAEAGPSTSETAEALAEETTASASGPSVSGNDCSTLSTVSAPSAPPFPAEYVPSSDEGPIHYPSIDTSPVEVGLPSSAEHTMELSANLSKGENNTSGACVICWDAPAEGVCIPCGHLAGCMACLNEIKGKSWGCPVCRATIEQVVKVYAVC
eukprot:Gb_32675 [translate_table: standard]